MNHTKRRNIHISPSPAPEASPSVRYDLTRGLGEVEIRQSREVFGDNTLTKKKKDSFIKQFFRNFNDPIIRILLGALGINILLTLGHVNWLECGGIAAAVAVAGVLWALLKKKD